MTTGKTRLTIAAAAFAAAIVSMSVSLTPIDTARGMVVQAQTVTLSEAFRIGDEAAGDTMLLGGVAHIRADSKGQVYVVESAFNGIRIFSAAGDYVARIGRSGAGPGEFQGVPQIHVGPGDTLYAFDFWPRRLAAFSPNSHEHEYSLTLGTPNDACPPTALLGVEPKGFVLQCSDSVGSPEEAHATQFKRVYVQDWSRQVVADSIAVLPVQEELVHTTTDLMQFLSLSYGRSPHFVYSSGGVLHYAWNGAIRIRAVGLDGTLQNEISVSHEPVQVTRKERDDALAYYRRYSRNAPFESLARTRLPSTKPAFSYFLVDDLGRLWISLSVSEGASAIEWLILDHQGQVIASAELPRQMRPLSIRGNRIYGRLVDPETHIQIAVVWDMAIR